MGTPNNGIIKIRRSWTEEGVSVVLSLVIALVVVFVFNGTVIVPLYAVWFLVFLHMNRQLGIDLTPTGAVVRTLFWRSRTVARADITDVTILKQGSARFVALQVRGAKRPVKLPIKNAMGSFGETRLTETHAVIRQWWLDTAPAAAAPVTAQMPGSASI